MFASQLKIMNYSWTNEWDSTNVNLIHSGPVSGRVKILRSWMSDPLNSSWVITSRSTRTAGTDQWQRTVKLVWMIYIYSAVVFLRNVEAKVLNSKLAAPDVEVKDNTEVKNLTFSRRRRALHTITTLCNMNANLYKPVWERDPWCLCNSVRSITISRCERLCLEEAALLFYPSGGRQSGAEDLKMKCTIKVGC